MPGRHLVEVTVVLKNEDAVDAFGEAMELLEETLEDTPWLDGVREALEKLEFAAASIVLRGDKVV